MRGHDDESLGSATAVGEPAGFRWRRRHTVLAVALVIVVAALVASLVSIPYYAITPGTAQSVGALIGVPTNDAHHHKGQVLLVDVELVPLRAIEWPYFELDSNAEIVRSSELLGPETAAQYQVEGELDMHDAQQAATVMALRTLGYRVTARPIGALIYAVIPGSPAARYLPVGAAVTAVDRAPVTTAAGLGLRLARFHPGERVIMRFRTYHSAARTVSLRLGEWRIKGRGRSATLVCPTWGTGRNYRLDHVSPETDKAVKAASCIGVYDIETSYRTGRLPLRVDLASEGIIGPSAGLAFTLGLIERLDPYDLTGGHKIAATGTMSLNGQVGDVGGVAQKTVAVRAAGAAAFFVPQPEYKTALAHAGGHLKVYPVTSLAQVIRILQRRYGGRLPASAAR